MYGFTWNLVEYFLRILCHLISRLVGNCVAARLTKPLIAPGNPVNTTVYAGDVAILQCSVVSDVEPTIQVIVAVGTE